MGKYIFGVLYYATLSMYRIDRQTRYQAAFITFALLNASYTSVWDLIMDWSLGNAYAAHPLLRDNLAFRRVWVYYAAMIIDVVVRFNWIFYAIFFHDIQHSALMSFIIAVSEVSRRGIWTIFRVENEHCTNVTLFRASRDVPLPYEVRLNTPGLEGPQEDDVMLQEPQTPFLAPGDPEQGSPSTPSLRNRTRRPSASIARVGTAVSNAHAQDFQRRLLPVSFSHNTIRVDDPHSSGESSDDDDEAVEISTDDDSGSAVDAATEEAQAANGRSPMHRIAE